MEAIRKRSLRYRREGDPKPFRLTTRDEEIIRLVYEYRILNSVHIDDFIGGSRQHLRRRLQILFQHGYLDRIRDQAPIPMYSGSKPLLYTLGRQGEIHLVENYNAPRPKTYRTDRFDRIRSATVTHTLLVADFISAVARACRHTGNIRLIQQREIIEKRMPHDIVQQQRRRNRSPFEWSINVTYNKKRQTLGLRPDALFGLEFLDHPEGKENKYWFFLEADRGTEIVSASSDLKSRQSATRKLLSYRQSWKNGVYESRFGIPNFRTIFLISTDYTGKKRVQSFINENKRLTGNGSGLFIFIDRDTFQKHENILITPFINGKDETVYLDHFNSSVRKNENTTE